jgi:abhydrolase domain-containing protein 13
MSWDEYLLKLVTNVLTVGVVGLTSLGIYLYANQKSLIYPANMPEGSRELVDTPDKLGLPYEDVWFNSEDGLKLHGYFIEHPQNAERKFTILYCHANAGNMGHRLPIVKILYHRFDANVFIFSYRGYGKSEGHPYEEGMKNDAQSAANYLFSHEHIDKSKLILYGQSIGGAVAIYIASKTELKVISNIFLRFNLTFSFVR